ncbi:type VI secretion system Vgr family protein [Dyella silvatica]|uniref:type VI secretion system Vgr family protein n=1 Tax=Dyella silvatica TaxID=2992128 RepID=UPI0022546BF2|nr:type VI secretion system tip protein TssI/VgrG [Dyella silvatica]
MPFTTRERTFTLGTPLGEDELLIQTFEGSEHLSQPFHFKLTLLSERDDITPDKLIGKRVTLGIETADAERHWTGLVSSFTRLGTRKAAGTSDETLTTYHCEIVPWIRLMMLNEDCRIFQNQSIPEIVEAIFADFQFSDYEFQLTGTYEPLVYCTQYRETNFNFIARLLERAGIYYYFRHEAKTETLVLVDNKDGNPPLDPPQIRFGLHGNYQDGDTISGISRSELIRSGRIVTHDYNFEKPATDLTASADSMVKIGDNSNYERFISPAGYTERNQGEKLARLLVEVEESEHETLRGESDARLLTAGYVFDLEDHPDDDLNQRFLIVSVEHHGNNNLDGDGSSSYHNNFSVIPHDVPYRSPLTTARARMPGPQTAVVTGPPGEEIYTDKHGRVKVHFFWDRRDHHDDKSSCWLRVAQTWAGRGWGSFYLPRVGMEVIVDFLEGDPDRPIVIGCVYNGDNTPPYELPGEMTKSTIKTWSSKGGDGFNELRFEDKKGSEQVFIHAQKDLDLRVQNDSREWVEQDRHLVVKRDRLEEVHRSHHLYIKKDHAVEIAGDDNLKISGKQAIKISGSQSVKVDGAVGESFQSHSEQVASNYYLNAGANVVIEAGAMITLKVGGNYITISPAGVTIVGTIVMINSGGPQASGSAASLVPPLAVLAAAVADKAIPGQKMDVSPLGKTRPAKPPGHAAVHDPDADENKKKTHYIEVELVDDNGKPVAGESVRVTLPDGSTVAEGTTDEKGRYKVTHIDPGQCKVSFPNLDQDAWKPA